jgi:hypothetical protein
MYAVMERIGQQHSQPLRELQPIDTAIPRANNDKSGSFATLRTAHPTAPSGQSERGTVRENAKMYAGKK